MLNKPSQRCLGGLTGLGCLGAALLAPPAIAAPTTTCAYNPDSGKPNPLGMRAFITITEEEGNTTFLFEQFPSNVGGPVQATIASRRSLTMYRTPLARARQLMLNNRSYYNELMGSNSPEGFGPVNAVLLCKAGAAAQAGETGASGSVASPPAAGTIAALADGTYRLWNGKPPQPTMSDDDLIKAGGALFLFEKKGNAIRGFFGYIDSEPGACIRGTANGNTIAGFAFPSDQSTVKDTGDTFSNFGPANFLRVRRPATTPRGRRFYSSALLDLAGFNAINPGDRSLAKACPPEALGL